MSSFKNQWMILAITCLLVVPAIICCAEPLALLTNPTAFPKAPLNESKGTLVVTYHTGRKNERIDRIRFRLTHNEDLTQTIYPLKDAFWDDPVSRIRHVIVEGLKPGEYTLEFIVPNTDGLFAPIPKRTVSLPSGEIVKVDQSIKPRYGRVKIQATLPKHASSTYSPPLMILEDSLGRIMAQGHRNLTANDLTPGEYVVHFEPRPGLQTPQPVQVHIDPGAVVGPIQGEYLFEN